MYGKSKISVATGWRKTFEDMCTRFDKIHECKARYTLHGDKVKFNTVDFVEMSTVSLWPAPYTLEKTFDIRATKTTQLATVSNSSCCRFVAKTGNKVDRIATVDFAADLSLVPATVDFFASAYRA